MLADIIPIVEVAHTLAAQATNVVRDGAYQVGSVAGTSSFINVTNLVAGSTFEFGQRSQLVVV